MSAKLTGCISTPSSQPKDRICFSKSRALTRAVKDLKIGPLAAAFGRSPGSDLGERQHRNECVVKVMCDTARQEAERFQPPRLVQLYFTLVLSCVCTLLVAAAGAPKRIPEALSPDL
jgi:hypothetical protein